MAGSGGRGDDRSRRTTQGQQAGSNRPSGLSGSERAASKKGGIPPKGAVREGMSQRSAPGKSNTPERPKQKPKMT